MTKNKLNILEKKLQPQEKLPDIQIFVQDDSNPELYNKDGLSYSRQQIDELRDSLQSNKYDLPEIITITGR